MNDEVETWAYQALKEAFRTWDAGLAAMDPTLEARIRPFLYPCIDHTLFERTTPMQAIRIRYAATIRKLLDDPCRIWQLEDEGHLSLIFNRGEEILRAIIGND